MEGTVGPAAVFFVFVVRLSPSVVSCIWLLGGSVYLYLGVEYVSANVSDVCFSGLIAAGQPMGICVNCMLVMNVRWHFKLLQRFFFFWNRVYNDA